MTENHNENSELDKLLDEASKVDLYPSQQLLSRVLEEASAVQAEFAKAPIQPTHQGWIRELIRALGGWPSMAGLATATVTGVSLGFSLPAGLSETGVAVFGQTDTGYLVDLFPELSFDLGEETL